MGAFREKAEALGKPLPISSVSVSIRLLRSLPALSRRHPLGFNELSIAGAIRGKAVELAPCVTIDENVSPTPNTSLKASFCRYASGEDQNSNTGKGCRIPGYTAANAELPVIKVKAVTHRVNPIMQTCIGPSEEHVSMAGIPTGGVGILDMVEKSYAGPCTKCLCTSSGGGKFIAVIQFKKTVPSDEGRQRQAALLAFSAFPELKQVILVDEDVDIFDTNDVLWAMTTRMQADVDIVTIPGVRCHPLDPSNDPACSWSIRDHGIACKTIYDATVPFNQKARFQRAKFMEVDVKKFLPDFIVQD